MHVEKDSVTWHFNIILISLKVKMAQISDFLIRGKILPLLKVFFTIYLAQSTPGKKDIVLIFLYLTSHGLL